MNFGLIALAVLAAWSALSIITSVLFGGMASGRDVEPAAEATAPRPVAQPAQVTSVRTVHLVPDREPHRVAS